MSFHEPTPESLRALAGWAISRRTEASAEQQLALSKFQLGCMDLAECCPHPVSVETSGFVRKTPVPVSVTATPSTSLVWPEVFLEPKEKQPVSIVLTQYGMVKDCNGVEHTFDIRTQKCKSCGRTYVECHGRKPELM